MSRALLCAPGRACGCARLCGAWEGWCARVCRCAWYNAHRCAGVHGSVRTYVHHVARVGVLACTALCAYVCWCAHVLLCTVLCGCVQGGVPTRLPLCREHVCTCAGLHSSVRTCLLVRVALCTWTCWCAQALCAPMCCVHSSVHACDSVHVSSDVCGTVCVCVLVCTALCARAGVHSPVHMCVLMRTDCGAVGLCAQLCVCVGTSGCAQALQVCVGLSVCLCMHGARVCWCVKALRVQAGLTHASTCALVWTLYV